MFRSTSFMKNFPSAGTIMICNLSDNFSATILLISRGFCFRIAASLCIRSASAAAVTRIRSASASASNFRRSVSALLSITLASAEASAF